MKTIFHIARWEFTTRFRTRSFIIATFVLPVLFSVLITLPVYLITYEKEVSTKLVGLINLADEELADHLQAHLNKNYKLGNQTPEYIILPVSVDRSPAYQQATAEFKRITDQRDSLQSIYDTIKERRASYFKNRNLQNRTYILQKTYEDMVTIREEKDLLNMEYENYQIVLDSVFNKEARLSADSLLIQKVLNAYLLLPPNVYKTGYFEYHSLNPGDLLEAERMQKILTEVIIKTRLEKAEIETRQIMQWLNPIEVKKYQLRAKGPTEWDFYIEFYGAVIGVMLLFMAIFTSGGFLFSSVLQEKTNRVIEVLLSYASSRQIMAGKIFGLGFLGLMQVLIWLGITAIFVFFNLFEVGQISYLNIENAFYFLHYFSLGYLFYAAIFVAIGAVFSSEQEAQQVNLILRTIAAIPVLLVFLFLKEPESAIISVLTYIPLFTPYFMILKILQYGIPQSYDFYLTSSILVVSIIGLVFVAARIFRIGILMYGKKFTFREVIRLLRAG